MLSQRLSKWNSDITSLITHEKEIAYNYKRGPNNYSTKHISRKLRTRSHLLKKSLMKNFIFLCSVFKVRPSLTLHFLPSLFSTHFSPVLNFTWKPVI